MVDPEATTHDDAATTMSALRLILASSSPRRKALLDEAGYSFEVVPADVDESKYPATASPAEIAQFLAVTKAEAVAANHPQDVVLAADTVVAFGEQLLGKPTDLEDARRILSLLSGTTHLVITGIAVIHEASGFFAKSRVMSAVRMKRMTPREIDDYLKTGSWEGKAGAYGIQDNDPFVTRMTGSQSNIVGLPMGEVKRLLAEAGIISDKPPTTRETH